MGNELQKDDASDLLAVRKNDISVRISVMWVVTLNFDPKQHLR
jgi:hypothetical protein